MVRTVVGALILVVGALCITLIAISIVHDLSDGKVDGVKYVNGCDRG